MLFNLYLIQQVKIKEARELIVDSFSNDDYAVNFFRYLMERTVKGNYTNPIKYKIMGIIRKGMIDQFVAADQEINVSGTLALIFNEIS